MSAPVIYLSGPMTGLPDNNYPEFNRIAAELRGMGYTVENPAENQPNKPEMSWSDWMRLAIVQMMRADRVVFLRGWDKSAGARLEFKLATELGIQCVEWAYREEGAAH